MPCKTCDHTMQRVNNGEPRVFWCPRCGTLKTDGAVPVFEAPRLAAGAGELRAVDVAAVAEVVADATELLTRSGFADPARALRILFSAMPDTPQEARP